MVIEIALLAMMKIWINVQHAILLVILNVPIIDVLCYRFDVTQLMIAETTLMKVPNYAVIYLKIFYLLIN